MKKFISFALTVAVVVSASAVAPGKLSLKPLSPLSTPKVERVEAQAIGQAKAAKAVRPGQKKKHKIEFNASKRLKARKHATVRDGVEEVLYNESFECLSKGSESSPVLINLDEDDNIPASIIGEKNYGIGGELLYQGGGSLYIKFDDPADEEAEGYMWTPDFEDGVVYSVTLDAKIANKSAQSDVLVGYLTDYEDVIDFDEKDLTGNWQTYEFVLDGSESALYGVYYMIFYADAGADIMIRNFVVTAQMPTVSAPVALPYTNYTGTSFTANWEPVENATAYLLTVAELDPSDYSFVEPYLMDQVEVLGTSCEVTGIEPGKIYYYLVQATDGEYISSESDMIEVAVLLDPKNIKGVLAEDGSTIDVSWDAVPGANYYLVNTLRYHTAKEVETFEVVNVDFSDIKSTGTFEEPEMSDYWTEDVAPGWTFSNPYYIDGAIGVIDDWIISLFYGIAGEVQSELMDLSGVEGHTIDVQLKVASSNGSSFVAYLAVYDEEEGDYVVGDMYESEPLTTAFTDVAFSLTADSDNCFVIIMPVNEYTDDEDYTDPDIYFRALCVTADLTAGSIIGVPSVGDETEATSVSLDGSFDVADSYKVAVTPYTFDDEGYVVIAGSRSAYVDVESLASVKSVVFGKMAIRSGKGYIVVDSPAGDKVTVANVLGQARVHSVKAGRTEISVAPGVYVVNGSKVVVR